MLVVHATKKLLNRIGTPTVEPTTRSTTVLGSWYATDDLLVHALCLTSCAMRWCEMPRKRAASR